VASQQGPPTNKKPPTEGRAQPPADLYGQEEKKKGSKKKKIRRPLKGKQKKIERRKIGLPNLNPGKRDMPTALTQRQEKGKEKGPPTAVPSQKDRGKKKKKMVAVARKREEAPFPKTHFPPALLWKKGQDPTKMVFFTGGGVKVGCKFSRWSQKGGKPPPDLSNKGKGPDRAGRK